MNQQLDQNGCRRELVSLEKGGGGLGMEHMGRHGHLGVGCRPHGWRGATPAADPPCPDQANPHKNTRRQRTRARGRGTSLAMSAHRSLRARTHTSARAGIHTRADLRALERSPASAVDATSAHRRGEPGTHAGKEPAGEDPSTQGGSSQHRRPAMHACAFCPHISVRACMRARVCARASSRALALTAGAGRSRHAGEEPS